MKSLDDLKFDYYRVMKEKGMSAEEACLLAAKQGVSKILIVRMLRDVYELEFDDAMMVIESNLFI